MCVENKGSFFCGDSHVFYLSNTVKKGLILFKNRGDCELFCRHLEDALFYECCTLLAVYLTQESYHLIIRQDLYSAVKAARNT